MPLWTGETRRVLNRVGNVIRKTGEPREEGWHSKVQRDGLRWEGFGGRAWRSFEGEGSEGGGTLLSVFLLATLARVEPRASVLCTLASTMALRAATAFLVHRTSPPDASRMARLKKAIGTTLSAFTAARTFWRVRTVPGWYRGFLRAGFGVGVGSTSPPFSPFCCFLVLTGRPIAFSITILRHSAYRDCSKRRTLAGSRGRHRAGIPGKAGRSLAGNRVRHQAGRTLPQDPRKS